MQNLQFISYRRYWSNRIFWGFQHTSSSISWRFMFVSVGKKSLCQSFGTRRT